MVVTLAPLASTVLSDKGEARVDALTEGESEEKEGLWEQRRTLALKAQMAERLHELRCSVSKAPFPFP